MVSGAPQAFFSCIRKMRTEPNEEVSAEGNETYGTYYYATGDISENRVEVEDRNDVYGQVEEGWEGGRIVDNNSDYEC